MRYHIGDLDQETLLGLYEKMLKPRMIEEKMLILLRQGKISKWFSGIGQEAISVGVTAALKEEEYILPMHRNLGVFTTRDVPLNRLFSQWQGKAKGFTKGRDRSFHFGSQEHRIVGMISHLGPQLGVADGIALADVLRKKRRVTAAFTGEGATSEGDFHEALNVASVWNLPVLFCIENNGYGLSTPTNEQYNCEHLVDRAKGYGMECRIIDGNNILEVHSKIVELCKALRKRSRPVLLEFKTFRMRGHEEASGTKYVPEKLMKQWAKKDPISNYETFLLKEGVLSEKKIEGLKEKIAEEINANLELAFAEDAINSNVSNELNDVYHGFNYQEFKRNNEVKNIRFVDAISDGLRQSMEQHNELVIMGQDVAEYGGVFKITEGFVKQFGKKRVRNTPICESAIVSAAMGLSINGMKAVVEMQFADFVSSGFNPVVNYLAKVHYRWAQKADVVIRMPCGGGVGAGPFHSQTNEAWFTKTPGLKVVYPAFPEDAKGLLITAINDPNPVLFFEHKGLYRSVYGDVPENYYSIPLGVASLLKEGDEVTIVSYGAGVHWALETLENHPKLHADLIDLRSLQPLDWKAIYSSVRKTGRLIILQEDTLFGGIASDIAAQVMEQCFEYLDAPIKRVGSIETPVPFAKNLENDYLPRKRFEDVLLELVAY
ncbi:alpha-ketoacid dehydrogenase subunit alpha/beta [Croceitalea rosinachiae]|uniref:Dehydrogenase E1 component subunit alpha/beta n=1 Tax=Croceitalea rosinachiae TaxID=3075596 RepID=A0ABU3ACJ7_9FLAO|nr:dehydrogenase E1 component subunit alpha/beta [Croceitalea sp. F388]MDT0607638.1 dehydrogenase E1 component subunit alpha/beta [Croceitalea sp. F388]